MTYKQVKNLKDSKFKRLCRVKPQLFDEMRAIFVLKSPRIKQRGEQPKSEIEDQLLITLEYWREYRT